MNSDGYFTTSDMLNYQRASKEIMLYLINMLNIYSYDKSVKFMMGDRIKSIDSINSKISKKKKMKGTDFDIQLDLLDIAGLRVVFCDRDFIVPSLRELDRNIHGLSEEEFEYEFHKSCEYKDNCDIVDIFNFLNFVEKNSDNIIIVKDYISYPKEDSGYQSLHVIFMASNGCPVEVQFRNYSQHLFNEYEHDIRYKGDSDISKKCEYIFDKCSKFLKNVTDDALNKFYSGNRSSKKITLTR